MRRALRAVKATKTKKAMVRRQSVSLDLAICSIHG